VAITTVSLFPVCKIVVTPIDDSISAWAVLFMFSYWWNMYRLSVTEIALKLEVMQTLEPCKSQ